MSQRVWAAASVAMKERTAAAASFFEFMVRSLKGRTAAVCQTRGEGVNRAAARAMSFHTASAQWQAFAGPASDPTYSSRVIQTNCAPRQSISNSEMSLSGGGFGLTLIGARPSMIFAWAWAIESVMRDPV